MCSLMALLNYLFCWLLTRYNFCFISVCSRDSWWFQPRLAREREISFRRFSHSGRYHSPVIPSWCWSSSLGGRLYEMKSWLNEGTSDGFLVLKSSQSKTMQTLLPTYCLGIEREEVGLVYFKVKLRNKLYDVSQNGEGNMTVKPDKKNKVVSVEVIP